VTDTTTNLQDVYGETDKEIAVSVDTGTSELGILLSVEGYGTCAGGDEDAVVLIENREGIPHVVVWADQNQEDPTHVISLEKAMNSGGDV
jgi:hypothetical protein